MGRRAHFERIPALGEDTEAVLRELGYSNHEIERLRLDQVI